MATAMARPAFLLLLFAFCAMAASPALARRSSSSRRLGGYPKGSSSSSPTPQAPYMTPSSGSSPTPKTPSVPAATVPSTPSSPVVIPPVSSTPTGYGGYGKRTGKGTSGFLGKAPKVIPRILSLVSSIAKLFGPRLLKFFKGGKAPSVLGALKDTSPEPMPSLAREATASLINAYRVQGFPLSTGQVITQFNAALQSPQLAAQQALEFQQLNEGV